MILHTRTVQWYSILELYKDTPLLSCTMILHSWTVQRYSTLELYNDTPFLNCTKILHSWTVQWYSILELYKDTLFFNDSSFLNCTNNKTPFLNCKMILPSWTVVTKILQSTVIVINTFLSSAKKSCHHSHYWSLLLSYLTYTNTQSTVWQDMSKPLYSGCQQDAVAYECTCSKFESWTLHSAIAKKWNRWSTASSRTVPSGGNRDTSYVHRRNQPPTSRGEWQTTCATPPNSCGLRV